MTHRTDAQKCCDKCRVYSVTSGHNRDCPCHTPHTTSSEWEREILSKYFVSRLGGDHVGAQDELIADIHTHIENARRETLNKAIKSISSLKTEGRPNPYSDERYRNDALDEAIQSLQATNKES